MALGIKPGD
jgi:chromosome segregation ATPase